MKKEKPENRQYRMCAERLNKFIAAIRDNCETASAPVAWRWFSHDGWHASADHDTAKKIAGDKDIFPLYAEPRAVNGLPERIPLTHFLNPGQTAYATGWNECRQNMIDMLVSVSDDSYSGG